jgi:Protein of unknown function (DUF998)
MTHATAQTACIGMLALSAVCLGAAPLVVPPGYDWLSMSISESAGQGLHGAWLARLGFLAFGGAALILALAFVAEWAKAKVWCVAMFGACMLGTAAFSHAPWQSGAHTDPTEDMLHSITASAMGFAFAMATTLSAFMRHREQALRRLFDGVGAIASVGLSLAAANSDALGGVFQRAMFVLAYAWFSLEALDLRAYAKKPRSGA